MRRFVKLFFWPRCVGRRALCCVVTVGAGVRLAFRNSHSSGRLQAGAKIVSINRSATEANFADYFARVADHQSMRRNIANDDCARANQCIRTNCSAADNGDIGADRSATHDAGWQECIAIPANERARTKIVCKHGVGSDEKRRLPNVTKSQARRRF